MNNKKETLERFCKLEISGVMRAIYGTILERTRETDLSEEIVLNALMHSVIQIMTVNELSNTGLLPTKNQVMKRVEKMIEGELAKDDLIKFAKIFAESGGVVKKGNA